MKTRLNGLLTALILLLASTGQLGCTPVASMAEASHLDHNDPPQAQWKEALTTRDPEALTRLAQSTNCRVLTAVVKNPRTPPAVLKRIANSGLYFEPLLSSPDREDDRDVILAFFENPYTPGSAIAALDRQFPGRYNIIGDHPNTPPDVLMKKLTRFNEPGDDDAWMKTDPEWKDYVTVLNLSGNPTEALKFMAKSKINNLRWEAALSAATPRETLVSLIGDGDKNVRENLAKNPSLPVAEMKKLALDPETDVRHGLTLNSACPRELLEQLTADKSDYVREDADKMMYMIYGVKRK